MNPSRILALLAACALALPVLAQPAAPDLPDRPVDAATRRQVLEAAVEALEKGYVFPQVAERMAAAIRERDRAGEYAALDRAQAFARKLTQDLQAVSRDLHLRVRYEPNPPQPAAPGALASQARLRAMNFGFEKVERLAGNVAYLELRSFQGRGAEAEQVADAAMTMVANADALIVDLRRNGGGSPHMVAHVSSYLFDAPTHLNSLYWRQGDRTEEFWTKPVAGARFGQAKPVFVLTSKRTFSGAEEFAYNLKSLKRATLVGEATGGGAHPGGVRRLHEHFSMFVPTGRAINPVTGTNWEGTGVLPDVQVPEGEALERALQLAREAVGRGA